MRVNLFTINDTFDEVFQATRYTDEIAEHEGMGDDQFYSMESELERSGRYWITPKLIARKPR